MENSNLYFSLSYLPLHIRLRCMETAKFPPFFGSVLHGILGWALKKRPEVYDYLFENRKLSVGQQDVPNPYLIVAPRHRSYYAQGENLEFTLVLLGHGIKYAKDVLEVLVETKHFELGAERKPFELAGIYQPMQKEAIWTPERINLQALNIEHLKGDRLEKANHSSIILFSPLRIRRNGQLLTEIDFKTLFRNISRRVADLTTRYGGHINLDEREYLLEQADSIETISNGLYLVNLERFSNRQNQKMDMSGLLGTMTFRGDLSPFVPWLQAAKVLHVGRNVTFGCGCVDVVYG